MKIPKTLILLVLSVFSIMLNAQNNLVPNGSFETSTAYPTYFNQISNTVNWYTPTSGTAEYFHASSQYDFIGVPSNIFGFQKAYNIGKAYAGIIGCGTVDYSSTAFDTVPNRGYIQTKLDSPLIAGKTYYLSFYVSLADSSRTAGDGMGAYVSQTPVTLDATVTNVYANLPFNPQVSNSSGVLSDNVNWKRISGSFVASGGEEYITIGNFKDHTSTTFIQRFPNGGGYWDFGYYYIDEVCLSLSSETCSENVLGLSSLALNSVTCYYNSLSDRVIFKGTNENLLITLSDLSGKTVKESKVNTSNEMDVSDLEPGYYLMTICDQKNRTTRKIIIE